MIQMSIRISRQLRLVQRDAPFGMGGHLVREQCCLSHCVQLASSGIGFRTPVDTQIQRPQGLASGPLWIPKSRAAQVPCMKWHNIYI